VSLGVRGEKRLNTTGIAQPHSADEEHVRQIRKVAEPLNWILGRKAVRMEMDGTGSGSCPMASFCGSGVEPLVSTAIMLVGWLVS
jgi:hypothetical protein